MLRTKVMKLTERECKEPYFTEGGGDGWSEGVCISERYETYDRAFNCGVYGDWGYCEHLCRQYDGCEWSSHQSGGLPQPGMQLPCAPSGLHVRVIVPPSAANEQ